VSDNEDMTEDGSFDRYSLESILAEYKGSAFINGDKRTPPELLQERADEIIREAVGSAAPNIELAADDAADTEGIKDAESREGVYPDYLGAAEEPAVIPERPVKQSTDEKDSVVMFFENYRSPISEEQDELARDVEKAVQKELGLDKKTSGTSKKDSRAFVYSEDAEEEPGVAEEEVFEEPDLKDAADRFIEAYSSISLRCVPAVVITIIMVILTFAFEAGLVIPFGIGRAHVLATGALMIGLLAVMIICVDLVVRGVGFLIQGVPNAETLLLFSCVFSLISAAFSMISGSTDMLPYCAISAFSLSAAAVGERYSLRAITETVKTAIASNEPFGVLAEYNREIDKSVLKKAYNRTEGFYNNLMHPDIVESAYRYAAPVLLVASLVLSVFAALVKGQGEHFLHIISALFAASAPFSALLAFAVPFSAVARTIRRSGAAIAGWGGADDICFTDGACVTDDDLFPPGTLKLNGLKLYEGVSPEKAIRYTASLVMKSGSGLSQVFSELLKTQGMRPIKVEDFACYEGGVSALIRGERVAIGSVGFMNLLGFRIPDDMNMKNAVYTAINDKLVAVFAVDYSPANSVQGALISILKWRIKIFFAVRDFNVTPSMLEQKFRVSLEDVAYVQAKDSYSISDSYSEKEGRIAAILTREGFGPFAEAVTGGRLLKSAALVATVASIVSAALGVIIMFYMCWSGAFLSAKPGNLMLFMLAMLAAVLLICGYVRCRK